MNKDRLFDLDLFAHFRASLVRIEKRQKGARYDPNDIKKFNKFDKADILFDVLEDQADAGKRSLMVSGEYDVIYLLLSAIGGTSEYVKKGLRIHAFNCETNHPSVVIKYVGKR